MSIRRVVAVGVAIVFSLAVAGAQEISPLEPIPNWTAPPYWTPPATHLQLQKPEMGFSPEAIQALPSTPLPFVAISPCRLLDTRPPANNPLDGDGVYAVDEIRTYTLPGPCGLPAGIQAVSLNVTATNTGAQAFGHIKVWPADGTEPNVSTLNYPGAGATIANAAVVPLSSTGAMRAKSGNATADLIMDVNGYYAPAGIVNSINGLFGAVTLAGGTNISITPSGQTLTVAAPNVDAATLGGQPPSYYQTIAAPPPSGNTVTTLDPNGYHTSVTIGTDGLGLIAYYDGANLDLKVAHCSDIRCTSATITPLDVTGNVGTFPSVIIGADGLGLISYFDDTSDNLKVAHCSNILCTSATITPLDTAGTVGQYTSVTIGADGLGLISYYDGDLANLKVAHCSNTLCTSATITSLVATGSVGFDTSITTGADGLGLISYYGEGDLNVAHCSDTPCTSATVTPLDVPGNSGGYTSVTIGADGLGLISYLDFVAVKLKVAHCDNILCTSATKTTIETGTSVGSFTSITIGADGLGLITYHDNSLGVAHCSNTLCTSATVATVDSAGSTGLYNSVTIGSDGLPLIAYRSTQFNALRAAHCSNALCAPFFRRR